MALSVATLLALAGCGVKSAVAKPAASTSHSSSSAAATKVSCGTSAESIATPPGGVVTLGSPINTPVQLIHGNSLAEVFTTTIPIVVVAAQSPTWFTTGSGYTLYLRKGAGLTGTLVACTVVTNATDNEWNGLAITGGAPAGTYTLVMEHPTGTATEACPGHRTEPNCSGTPLSGKTGGVIGWWENNTGATSSAYALVNGTKNGGSFSVYYEGE